MKKMLGLVAFVAVTLAAPAAGAEQAGLLFTGRTHAMVYPCTCPLEPSGGIARRATAVKDFAQQKIPFILFDTGDAFAGGLMDQYKQGDELDKARTEVNLKALELMGYSAVAIGDAELNFGWEYLQKIMATSKMAFISSTIRGPEAIKPFIIKKAGRIGVGITAVSPESAQQKIPGSQFISPVEAVTQAVAAMQEKKCGLIVLISNLNEKESRDIVQAVPAVDLLILNMPEKEGTADPQGNTMVLRSFWQGRKLDKAVVTLAPGKDPEWQFTEEVLSDKIADDKGVAAILPQCFSNIRCMKPGQVGTCVNPGTAAAQCRFAAAPKVRLTIVAAKDCLTCDTRNPLRGLEARMPGLEKTTLEYPGAQAEALMKDLGIKELPAYLLGKEVEKESVFTAMKQDLVVAGAYYRIKPEIVGFGYLPARPRIPEKLDLFIDLYMPNMQQLLDNVREFSPDIHFILPPDEQGQPAPRHGRAETEEYLRAVCVAKHAPGFAYSYVTCRAGDPESSWWDKCLEGVDIAPVRECAMGDEGARLLEENTALSRELNVQNGPTYLHENREIFSSMNVPSKEDMRKIIIRK